ncbi:MAG: helix-turn-helix domain-containing protein [Acidobacteriota bacterium]|nr:helix-turn-helix domain-containing protein [Acidobacteriota bacterium]
MRLLTAKEVAPILRVKTARVYELARERAIPAIRIGERQLRFDEFALREWCASGGSLQANEAREGERRNEV